MQELYGNTTGLSPQAKRTLERLYRRKIPLSLITTPELTKTLSDASKEAGRQVGVLVRRAGDVEFVIVGDATRLMLPDVGRLRAYEGRYRGLRLIHTHLFGEELTRDDIVDLVRLRLDLVAAIQLSPEGEPRSIHCAHNLPPSSTTPEQPRELPYRLLGPFLMHRIDVDFGELIRSLEDEAARGARLRSAKSSRAILVHVGEKSRANGRPNESLRELSELSRTAGVEVVDSIVQVRDRIDPKTILGKGKLDDVVLRAAELDAETLVFDRNLSPTQAEAIATRTDLRVIDRTQLILDIFAKHAESADGKLQVELAQLKYALPRLSLKDDALSRLTGGIGGRRGPGETKLEIGRRRARERVSHLESELKRLGKQRAQRRRKRARLEVPIVSIVGYTNAGKSTLLNTLTGSSVIAENKLFATLDTRSRRLRFPEEREVIITDTVGFIRELPKDLFAAFRATFEEVEDADLILHVVDASDPAMQQHIDTTHKLLAELGLEEIPRIMVLNKIDKVDSEVERSVLGGIHQAVHVSAINPATTHSLLDRIASILASRWDRSRWSNDPEFVEDVSTSAT
jgi:GTPase